MDGLHLIVTRLRTLAGWVSVAGLSSSIIWFAYMFMTRPSAFTRVLIPGDESTRLIYILFPNWLALLTMYAALAWLGLCVVCWVLRPRQAR
jgi:hypothetical protein